jgi:hypothetical protein
MVPVNALFSNVLITYPHDAYAAKRKHETKSVNVRTKVPSKQAHTHTKHCAQTQCAHAFTPASTRSHANLRTKRRAAQNTKAERASARNFGPSNLRGVATYSVVSAVSAEIVEGTLPTRDALKKHLRPALL